MGPFSVVVPDEFRQHRSKMLLIQDNQVIQALSAERPNDAFHDRVGTR